MLQPLAFPSTLSLSAFSPQLANATLMDERGPIMGLQPPLPMLMTSANTSSRIAFPHANIT